MRLVQEGMSLAEIAEDLGRSPEDVAAWCEGQRARGLLPGGSIDKGGQAADDPGGQA